MSCSQVCYNTKGIKGVYMCTRVATHLYLEKMRNKDGSEWWRPICGLHVAGFQRRKNPPQIKPIVGRVRKDLAL